MRTCHPHPNEEHETNESRGAEQSSISKGGGEYSMTKGGDYHCSDLCQFYIILMPANKQTNQSSRWRFGTLMQQMTKLYRTLKLCMSSGGNRTAFPRVASVNIKTNNQKQMKDLQNKQNEKRRALQTTISCDNGVMALVGAGSVMQADQRAHIHTIPWPQWPDQARNNHM